GDDKPELEKYCREYKLNNVHFLGRIDKNFIPFVLSMADCNVLNYQEAGTWKYGGSQNKLFEYLASGKPIVSNVHIGYSLIERYSCGIVADDNNAEAYAQAILNIYNLNKEEYENMCTNATKVACMYDYRILVEKLINVID
ncbi:MAG: glycosyltransferase, partial [Clostridia bacterium]